MDAIGDSAEAGRNPPKTRHTALADGTILGIRAIGMLVAAAVHEG